MQTLKKKKKVIFVNIAGQKFFDILVPQHDISCALHRWIETLAYHNCANNYLFYLSKNYNFLINLFPFRFSSKVLGASQSQDVPTTFFFFFFQFRANIIPVVLVNNCCGVILLNSGDLSVLNNDLPIYKPVHLCQNSWKANGQD